MPDDQSKPQSLQDVCGQLRDKAQETNGDSLQVQTFLDAFSGRIFGPLLLVPSLVVIIPPLGAIPFVPTTMGVLVLLIAGQALIGRKHPWIPSFISQREVSKETFEKALDRFEPWAKWVDWFTKPRLQFLVSGAMKYGIALLCVLLAISLPPLEVLPFAAALPGLGIFCLGLAITAQDGLLGLFGILAGCGVAGVLIWWLMFS